MRAISDDSTDDIKVMWDNAGDESEQRKGKASE